MKRNFETHIFEESIQIRTIVLFVQFIICLPFVSLSQSGSLDLTFNNDGMVITAIGNSHDYASSIAIQNDGKIVVAGASNNGNGTSIALVRYNTDGNLDNTFNSDGVVTNSIFDGVAHALAIQSDGKIIVAGESWNGTDVDFALIRYNTDGSLDNSFDTDGIITTPIGNYIDKAYSIAIQNDGKIVIAGKSFNGANDDFALARYNANGSLDNTFGTNGKVITSIGTSADRAFSLVLQIDGKIIVAGESSNSNYYDFALIRYNTNGSIDSTFGNEGIVITSIGLYSEVIHSLAIQSDGKIIAVGTSSNGPNTVIALARYNTNGTLDNNLDSDGILTTSVGNQSQAESVITQSDGKIVVAGSSSDGSFYDFALVRYNSNGSLDLTFDTDGKVTTSIGGNDNLASCIAIQSDGKIVVAGMTNNGLGDDFAVVRYNNIISGIKTLFNPNAELSIRPNPFITQTTISSEKSYENATIDFYNSLGQKVKSIRNVNGQVLTVFRDNLPSGFYYVHLSDNNSITIVDKLVITDR